MMTGRKGRLFAEDIRTLGGVVTVSASRDRITSEPRYCIGHITRGGDVAWTSSPISDEDRAREAARVLAEFTGSELR
jgi:hypothetical protein